MTFVPGDPILLFATIMAHMSQTILFFLNSYTVEDWMTWTFGTDIDVESVAKHVLNQRENLRQESRAVALQNSQEKCYQTLWDICNL